MVWESTQSERHISHEQGEDNALAEAALLLNQDRVLTEAMGGLFPERALAPGYPNCKQCSTSRVARVTGHWR